MGGWCDGIVWSERWCGELCCAVGLWDGAREDGIISSLFVVLRSGKTLCMSDVGLVDWGWYE